jgi:hypothetical protein
MAATAVRLGPVDVKGGLWGADLLAALADDRARLPADTIRPDSYGLPRRASTEQAARAAWTVLTAAWEEFSDQHTARVERDGTDAYGDDRFTYATWLRHLMDQLGYTPAENPSGRLVIPSSDEDDDRFPITHTHAGQVPLHLLAAGVPLDSRTRGVAGADRQSPHSLVQDYLNRTPRHLWAIVTNGLTLRILRDNAALSRQAHIEFDLAAIFDDGAYADFALLWHAAHATRFTHDPAATPAACIAERWQDHATATGVAALDDLRDGVEAAIAEIGQGLLEQPANTQLRGALDDPDDPFDAAAYYRELLYVAYRHVFWFTLDDRDLIHPSDAERSKVAAYRDHYASSALRAKARAHLGAHHPDGWQHYGAVAAWFADPAGQPALALPGLLGRLWDPDATVHLNDATLTNRRYYEALRRLGYVTRDGALQRINYDAMGSEEVGAVYESLLEIRPTVDTTQRRFALGRTEGSDRKKTGSYYTPTSLIKVLLDEALDPVLDERLKQAVHDLPTDATADQRTRAEEEAVLGTTICDPAMGSAHFLVAAGMRSAKRLAQIRTQEIEPSPEAVQQAFRDVASRSLYGVDLNPMAVELAKVAIWLECHVPGQPLTFLDHHLKQGNALLGVGFDPDLIAWNRGAAKAGSQKGVPDAAFKPLAGDDKAYARQLRDANRARRARGGDLRFHSAGAHVDRLEKLAFAARQLTDLGDDTPEALAAKQRAWADYEHDAELTRQCLRADAWMASWTIAKTRDATKRLTTPDPLADDDLPWDVYYDTFFDDEPDPQRPGIRAVQAEANRLDLFHWYVEFPDIAATGGWGMNVGNPPWEHTELKEKEWFANAGHEDIAAAKTASQRKKAIDALASSDDPADRQTAAQWQLDSRDAQAMSEFARTGGRFPRGGVGRVNTYALFADHFTQSVSPAGRVGIIVPTGLITDYTYRDFFAHLVDERRLAAAYDFENKGKQFFPDVHASFRFVTLIATAPGEAAAARFAFMVHDTAELDDASRSYTLTPEQIALVNPNTKTAPVFLTSRDASLTTSVYRSHGAFVVDAPPHNPWGMAFSAGLFNLSADSNLFDEPSRHRDNLPLAGLYEAKMFWHFDHRYATYEGETVRSLSSDEKRDPSFEVSCRAHIDPSEVRHRLAELPWKYDVLLCWRDIARATDQRTLVSALVPASAVGNSAFIAVLDRELRDLTLLLAQFCSFALDYIVRQKSSGTHLNYYLIKQLPVPNPDRFERKASWDQAVTLAEWIIARSAALSNTTQFMANALGYSRPAGWAERQREAWRTELDAAMFHVYGYSRDEVEYVMDTFSVAARRDRQAEGLAEDDPNWRTKRFILGKYDELARHAAAGTTYESPHPPPALPDRLRLRLRDVEQSTGCSAPSAAPPHGGAANG